MRYNRGARAFALSSKDFFFFVIIHNIRNTRYYEDFFSVAFSPMISCKYFPCSSMVVCNSLCLKSCSCSCFCNSICLNNAAEMS